mgnify:CR=1 FL=1
MAKLFGNKTNDTIDEEDFQSTDMKIAFSIVLSVESAIHMYYLPRLACLRISVRSLRVRIYQ